MSGKGRKKGGRVTPKGGVRAVAPDWLSSDERASLDAIFSQLLRGMRRDLPADADPLVAELWASHAWSVFTGQEPNGFDAEAVLGGGFIHYAARQHSAEARRALRALAAVAPAPYGARAAVAADRLGGVADAKWAAALARGVTPGEAWLGFDPIDDDGVSVMVGFDGGSGPHTVGVYIDHNLGGLVKDAFVVPAPISRVLYNLTDRAEGVELCPIDLAEARARWEEAFAQTDVTWDPPIGDDVPELRALIEARCRVLPRGGAVPEPDRLDDDQLEAVVEEFLAGNEMVELVGSGRLDEDGAALLASNIATYGSEYVGGTALRFSPVMVELFCCDWAPRKIGADEATFEVLPDVLRAWIRFAGRRRGIPQLAIEAAVDAIAEYEDEMLEAAADPASWGPAKSIIHAMLARGVDLGDERAVQLFVDSVNAEGGVDALV